MTYTAKLTVALALMVFFTGLVITTVAGLVPQQGMFHPGADLDTSTIDDLRADYDITLTVHSTVTGDDISAGA